MREIITANTLELFFSQITVRIAGDITAKKIAIFRINFVIMTTITHELHNCTSRPTIETRVVAYFRDASVLNDNIFAAPKEPIEKL